MPYNVRMTPRKARDRLDGDVVVNDLSRNALLDKIVHRYLRGDVITSRGRNLDPRDISEIKIGYTDEPAEAYYGEIEENTRGLITVRDISEFVPDKGRDVTDEFITGAPGSDPSAGAPATEDAQSQDAAAGEVDAESRETLLGPKERNVMVIYGRNELARAAMFHFLRALDLRPIDWDSAVRATGKGTPHNLEAVRAAMAHAQAIVALFTPDDLAALRPGLTNPDEPLDEISGQPRPNVLLETGMALVLKPDDTIIVHLGPVRPASDLAGLNYVSLPSQRESLRRRLLDSGCRVDETSDAWAMEGAFDEAVQVDDQAARASRGEVAAPARDAGRPTRSETAPAAVSPPDPGVAADRERRATPAPGTVSRQEYHSARAAERANIIDRFLEMHREVDQPFYEEDLISAIRDPKFGEIAARRLLRQLYEDARVYRNPDGPGWYVSN